jgi:hypothetical protein
MSGLGVSQKTQPAPNEDTANSPSAEGWSQRHRRGYQGLGIARSLGRRAVPICVRT